MDEREKELELEKRMQLIAAECGDEINLAIPMYEDPTRYPVKELLKMSSLQWRMMEAETPEERAALKVKFAEARKQMRLLPDAPERIYLWKEGNMPVQTEYTENPEHRYDHEPDFRPYMLEMLLDESVTPVGAIVLVAGGSHGVGTINECYQTGLDFNELGYQCFILQCRPNRSPWNEFEVGADVARALRMIRANAEKYRIAPDRVVYTGFSNGGLTGDYCIEHYSGNQQVKDYFPDYVPDELDELPGSPDAFLNIYGARQTGTVYKEEGVVYPPVFLVVGREDHKCIRNMEEYLPWLWRHKVPMEIHTFAGHPHGYAGWKIMDGKGKPNFDLWVTHADAFLKDLFQ